MKLDNLKEQQPTIHLLVGLPGSGKSTWIRSQKLTNTEVLSTDDYIEARASENGSTYSEVFDAYIKDAGRNLETQFANAVRNNMNIIHDQTNMSKKKRASILQKLPKNYKKIAVVFNVDDTELNRRLADRAATTGKSIPDHIIRSMKQNYQEPTTDEGFDQIIRK